MFRTVSDMSLSFPFTPENISSEPFTCQVLFQKCDFQHIYNELNQICSKSPNPFLMYQTKRNDREISNK